MEGNGHMNMRTDYTSERVAGEGYYNLKSNNADEAGVAPVWPNDAQNVPYVRPAAPKEDETEQVSTLQPLAYMRRANDNFFGGRTTFYNQIGSEMNLPVDDAADKIHDSWAQVMEGNGHMN